ncbi:MAG TPA: helicase-related protein [Gemmataceae bacterium]|nr:helicase-related protein [Gemmataceae bacterium]
MAKLEDLKRGASVKGILPDCLVTVIDVKWYGSAAIELTYKDPAGKPSVVLLYRDREPTLEVVESGRPWSFDGDGKLFRLVSEAHRIDLAHLFDPLLAIHTSMVDPLPHQITAVYGEMLPRQPLRFLLADDPGAGKTIMAGLLIKELLIRGDLHRCMIVCPGNLAEQWQDELYQRFQLPFEILTNDKLESARTGNWFAENPLAICRLDKLSRNEDVQAKLANTDWDLVVCDEAHKMSATFFGSEVKYTKRYRLGQLLGQLTRHLLMMTATPHNGKPEDFQLFLALLDSDRFEGRARDGVHTVDASDLMRRLVKEQLLKFDGTPLFPERRAYTVGYKLSDAEAALYKSVTDYVREEFNRADALESEGRKGTVGFALTILQRRLASSPEAILQSLRRRRERLERRLREEQILKRGGALQENGSQGLPTLTEEDIDDLDDAPDAEVEETEEVVVDQATAARTIAELQAEIEILKGLETLALKVRRSGTDKKWEELSSLLQNHAEMFDAQGHRRKMVIFSEHRDTLNYLTERLRALLGAPEALVTVHGGMGREERTKAQEAFKQDKDVLILLATDAAGEGINLQRAHLMVNYDLPWNPNRLEQRFGRIHRIGQTEVCHLWNLLAEETREGDVYKRLLEKIELEREALGGGVFDILGQLFREQRLRDLLIEAIRYGDQPEVKARLHQIVDNLTDRKHCQELLEERALANDSMDASQVQRIREDMERAEARRLQPHFIESFFLEAFRILGGSIKEREPRRFEITHVPALIRQRDRLIGTGEPVLGKYERITFEKSLCAVPGQPLATFVCPGQPLLGATIDLILERNRDLLKRGAVLVDPDDPGEGVRVLFYLEHAIQDGRTDKAGNRRVVSRQLQFVETDTGGSTRNAGYAPYLDYRPATDEERTSLTATLESQAWLKGDLETVVVGHAIANLVPAHLGEVRQRREDLVTRTMAAVKDRLTKEITYWDHRANQLKDQELAGKTNAKINSGKARQRADELQARLQRRMAELELERQIAPLPPVAIGGSLVVPIGLLRKLLPPAPADHAAADAASAEARKQMELLAMEMVMKAEEMLGNHPRDVSDDKCGYDIESKVADGKLRFIEVKGRVAGALTVTVTRNEILTALNKPEDFILAIGQVEDGQQKLVYIRRPFQQEPDFAVESINYNLQDLLAKGEAPK